MMKTTIKSLEDLLRDSKVIDLSSFLPPSITKLKDMRIETVLVRDGKPFAAVVVPDDGRYDAFANRIVNAIKEATGTTLPIVWDAEVELPFSQNLVVLGNRSTNTVVERLYNLYYTYLDLIYPGIGGYIIRSLHNPFGNSFNAILVGSSNDEGMAKAAEEFITIARQAARGNSLTTGWTMQIKLGKDVKPPANANQCRAWENSTASESLYQRQPLYQSISTGFGWNCLSRKMALYYMTGDEKFAREFLRLAFPHMKEIQEMWRVDGEGIEDKEHPLSGPYHYRAHLMILLWDLIEESPIFTDEQRLRITQAFSEQLRHWQAEGWAYAGRRYGDPNHTVGSRHSQYAALSLYCLARYFNKYYKHIVWQKNLEAAQQEFTSLARTIEVAGELDHLWWLSTGLEPIISYILISGDRRAIESGVLHALLRAYDAIISCEDNDENLRYQSLSFAHKAAYLTGDGRFIYYRNLTSLGVDIFRIGQSFFPPEGMERKPTELANRIIVAPMSVETWRKRGLSMPNEQAFQYLSYRTGVTASDDYLWVDGFYGGSRNPYHCLAIYKLRIGDKTLLQGYLNQVIARHGSVMEPTIPLAAVLKVHKVVGHVAYIEAEVPNFSHGRWRRAILHATGQWAVIMDELAVRKDIEDLEMIVQWQLPSVPRVDGQGYFDYRVKETGAAVIPWKQLHLKVAGHLANEEIAKGRKKVQLALSLLRSNVRKGEKLRMITLVGPQPQSEEQRMMCAKLTDNAAMLTVPSPALAAFDELYMEDVRVCVDAKAALVSENFIYASGAREVTLGAPLMATNVPVDIYWASPRGEFKIFCTEPATVGIAAAKGNDLRERGQPVMVTHVADGLIWVRIGRGQHAISGAAMPPQVAQTMRKALQKLVQASSRGETTPSKHLPAGLTELKPSTIMRVKGAVMQILPGPERNGMHSVYVLTKTRCAYPMTAEGKLGEAMEAPADIMSATYWREVGLLLLGGANDVVYAFDDGGRLKWTFKSEMHSDVLKKDGGAKWYWFKEALPGINGLATGNLTGEGTQAFVGSACTLEVLDADGSLINRLPQFWGCCIVMNVVVTPDGRRKLLSSKWPNGVNNIGIIDGHDWSISYGFTALPAGHTPIPNWYTMDTPHIITDDIDGDGRMEVVCDVNGSWNRVSVYDPNGKPLWAASFGPSFGSPHRHMRDLAVADLNGDGQKEVIAATEEGLLTAFRADGKRIWHIRLPASPWSMCIVPRGEEREGGEVAVGCDEGLLVLVDATGKLVAFAELDGCIQTLRTTRINKRIVLIAGTSTGQVVLFRL